MTNRSGWVPTYSGTMASAGHSASGVAPFNWSRACLTAPLRPRQNSGARSHAIACASRASTHWSLAGGILVNRSGVSRTCLPSCLDNPFASLPQRQGRSRSTPSWRLFSSCLPRVYSSTAKAVSSITLRCRPEAPGPGPLPGACRRTIRADCRSRTRRDRHSGCISPNLLRVRTPLRHGVQSRRRDCATRWPMAEAQIPGKAKPRYGHGTTVHFVRGRLQESRDDLQEHDLAASRRDRRKVCCLRGNSRVRSRRASAAPQFFGMFRAETAVALVMTASTPTLV